MVYDNEARKVAVKAIGTVESNFVYDAINYNDPITVGVMQWYGTRAAGVLNELRQEHPSQWASVNADIRNDVETRSLTSSWWTTRYLTRAEGNSLKPLLIAGKATQNARAFADLDDYKAAAERAGMDPENNTNAMLFFFVMYHQSPRQALRVVAAAGPDSSLNRLYSTALNNSVLSGYRSRYTTAKTIIENADTAGVDDPGSVNPDDGVGGDQASTTERLAGDINYIEQRGDSLVIRHKDGVLFAYPSTTNRWIPRRDESKGADVPPPADNPNPEVPPSSDAAVKRQAVADFCTSRLDKYKYSQGPARLTPDKFNYTDCSGLLNYAFKKVANIDIGSYTGAQLTSSNGRTILRGSGNVDLSKLEIADIVLFNWPGGRSTVDHVELYIGGGQVVGHGGPDNGPDIAGLQGMANNAVNWVVRRFIE